MAIGVAVSSVTRSSPALKVSPARRVNPAKEMDPAKVVSNRTARMATGEIKTVVDTDFRMGHVQLTLVTRLRSDDGEEHPP